VQHYYVLQVISGQEKKVKKSLNEIIQSQGLESVLSEVLIPTEQVSEVRSGKSKTSEKPVWRGYLILKMEISDELQGKILHIPGVLRFLGADRHGRPAPLKEEEAMKMLEVVEVGKTGKVKEDDYSVGSKVRISEGPFASYNGHITEIILETQKIKVNVSVFGRNTILELPKSSIEALDEERK
jgi:transcriptional antiterminator NusG